VVIIPIRSRLAAALPAFILATALAGAGGPAFATDPVPVVAAGRAITLDDALRLTRERNLTLLAGSLESGAARAQARDAGRRPNPTLAAAFENAGGSLGGGRAETSFLFEQPFELGGDRAARAGLGGALATASEAGREELRLALEAATVERFCDAWVLQRRVERLREAEALAGAAVASAEERLRAGAAPAWERTRAEGFRVLREIERRRAEAELADARRRLAVQWGEGTAAFDSLALPEPAPPALPPPDRLEARLDRHPARLRAGAARDAEGWRVREARAARVPDLQLGAGLRHLAEADGTGFVVGLSLPLPLWNGRSGAVAAAEAELEAAGARERQTALELRVQVQGARERFDAAVGAWTALRDRAHPAAREVLRLIVSGYRSGRLGYLDIQEGQRALLEAELLLIESSADVWRSWKSLERLVGVPLGELSPGREAR
jgi:cobalt-zinc-cadmium efflux system outer membrane protein